MREGCSRYGCRYRCRESEERKADFLLRVLFHIALEDERAEAEERERKPLIPSDVISSAVSSLPAYRNRCQKAPEVNLNHLIEVFLLLQ